MEILAYFFLWLILAILAGLTGFQVHATLIPLAITAVHNPALRPAGWSNQKIYGLSQCLWLVLGIARLFGLMLSQEYLREGRQFQLLKKRAIRLFLIIGITYVICSAALLLL